MRPDPQPATPIRPAPLRHRGRLIFSLAVAVAAAWAVSETIGWPIKTALYPRVVGIPLLVLAAVETVLTLRRPEESEAAESVDVSPAGDVEPTVAARRTAAVFAWIGLFFGTIIFIGFPRAVPLFVLAYLRLQAKERWAMTLVLTALAWGVFYGLFVRLLHVPFSEGMLWGVLFK